MTKVKICGLTNETDARHALLSGADFLGFIFYPPSPRAASVDDVRILIRNLQNTADTGPLFAGDNRPLLIGVFVNETLAAIEATLSYCGLDLAQLSGEEASENVVSAESMLRGRAYKSVQPQTAEQARISTINYSAPTPENAPTLMLDAYHPALRGGTGKTADWQLAAKVVPLTPRLMLAGGLNPANVAEAVRVVRPFAVDVASGVEASPGIKDPDKVRQFIAVVRQVK